MRAALCLAIALLAPSVRAESPALLAGIEVLANQAYKTGEKLSPYEAERCKLDLYLPKDHPGFTTLVWFHGGGLTGGTKDGQRRLALSLAKAGYGVAVPNYRLSPRAKFPACIEDAAAAVSWVHAHIAEHGGNPRSLFIGGHSAGGYLSLMLGLDAHYLGDAGIKLSDIAGVIPVSGQTMTHYTIRAERGVGKFTITADEAAPVFHTRKDSPPMLVLYADHDMPGGAEENAYFVAVMKGAGNTRITGKLISDRTHGSIGNNIANEGDPARAAIIEFIAANVSR